MANKSPEEVLVDQVEKYIFDPLGFVRFAFDWGHGDLREYDGPDVWQAEVLEKIGKLAKDGLLTGQGVRLAVASGHGIGKTALAAWIMLWFISTRPIPQIVTTANTKTQLDTKTWRELAKWHKRAINGHWFEWTAQKFYKKTDPATWAAFAIPWNKDKSDAFAGTHEKHVLILYDEASMVDDAIWEVTEGAMTTPGAMWVVFGNPTRNTGRFKECFGRFRHRWETMQIDSRTAKMADSNQIQTWVDDYGEDSDFVRVRVRGVFPRQSSMQFISEEIVRAAAGRVIDPATVQHAAVVIGVDVARFGDDQTVIYVRQGFATLEVLKYRGLGTIDVGNLAIQARIKWKADALFIDDCGVGGGVTDYINKTGHECIPVNAGAKSPERGFFNLRAYMWGKVKAWLEYGAIPDDPEIIADLTAPEYGFSNSEAIQIEKKADMKSRGLASPDVADALCLTFAVPIDKAYRDWRQPEPPGGGLAITDYDVLNF